MEGYSNFSWVAILAVAARLGLDGSVVARWLAGLGGVACLLVANRALPLSRVGWLGMFALTTWAALAYWSIVALETTTFASAAAIGWWLVLRNRHTWGWGMLALAAAAVTRPEGSILLAAAVVARARFGRERSATDVAGVVAIAAIAAYHAARLAWFASLVPTPYLVKVSGTALGWVGLHQATGDLLGAGGLLVAALCFRLPARSVPWALFPAVLGVAALVRADGDWMGMSRLVLPGFFTTFVAWVGLGTPRPWRTWRWALVPVVLAAGIWEVHWPSGRGTRARELAPLLEPVANLAAPMMTPFEHDLVWIVANIPDGYRIELADVGLIGQIPGIEVVDFVGLTHRPRAENRATGAHADALAARYAGGVDALDCTRRAVYSGPAGALVESEVAAALPHRYDAGRGEVRAIWQCREPLPPVPWPTQIERWRVLARRYPSQARLVEPLVALLARAGRFEEAFDAAGGVPRSDGQSWETVIAFPTTSHPPQPGRGVPLYWAQRLESRALPRRVFATVDLVLDADDPMPDGVPAEITWVPGCGQPPRRLDVTTPTALALAPPACAAEVSLVVTLLPHTDAPPRDRNLWVMLRPR